MAMALKHLWQGSTSPNWPNASNTGVSRGVVLTDSSVNSFNTGHNGMTIENKIFTDNVEVFGSNITFRNCRFQGFGLWGLVQYPDPPHNATNIRVERCEFDGGSAVHCSALGIGGGPDSAVIGCNIHHVTVGIQSFGRQIVSGNYMHDFEVIPAIEGEHFDGVTIFGGGDVTIENNAISMPDPSGGTACVFCGPRFSNIADVTLTDNLLIGQASFVVYLEDRPDLGFTTAGVTVRNCYMQRGIFGYVGVDAAEAPTEIGNIQWNSKSPDFDPAPASVQAWLATV